MPILHLPGEMMPGQFGPITRVLRIAEIFLRLDHIGDRNSLGDTDDERNSRVAGFHDRVGGKCGRHINDRRIRTGFSHSVGDRVKYRNAFVRGAALAGRDAADDIRAVITHLQHVKSAFFARDALHDQACVLIN